MKSALVALAWLMVALPLSPFRAWKRWRWRRKYLRRLEAIL